MEFVDWLLQELERRGWTNSELARRAGVVPSTVSMVISQQQRPGVDFCTGVAHAFSIAPEKVFRMAGLLPQQTTRQELIDEILFYFDQLGQTDQLRLITIAWSLAHGGRNRLSEQESGLSFDEARLGRDEE